MGNIQVLFAIFQMISILILNEKRACKLLSKAIDILYVFAILKFCNRMTIDCVMGYWSKNIVIFDQAGVAQ